MLDLRYKWHPNPDIPLDILYKEALELGNLSQVEQIGGTWHAVIVKGEWYDIHIRCGGQGKTVQEAIALAVAKAKWVAARLAEDPDCIHHDSTKQQETME